MKTLTRRTALVAALSLYAIASTGPLAAGENHEHMHVDAGNFLIHAPYARVMGKMAKSGAIFMGLQNVGETDDRLIGASTPVARMASLHTNVEDPNGVMKMVPIKGGVSIPAGKIHWFKRGGDHIMLMGLKKPLAEGDTIPLTLVFEKAGKVRLDVEVDNHHKGDEGMGRMNMKMGD